MMRLLQIILTLCMLWVAHPMISWADTRHASLAKLPISMFGESKIESLPPALREQSPEVYFVGNPGEGLPANSLLFESTIEASAVFQLLLYYNIHPNDVEFSIRRPGTPSESLILAINHPTQTGQWKLLEWELPEKFKNQSVLFSINTTRFMPPDHRIGFSVDQTHYEMEPLRAWAAAGKKSLVLILLIVLLVLPGLTFVWWVKPTIPQNWEFPVIIVVSLLIAYALFWAYIWNHSLGLTLSIIAYAIALGVCMRRATKRFGTMLSSDLVKCLSVWMLSALFVLNSGILTGGTEEIASAARNRYRNPSLPADNSLPYLFAQRLSENQPIYPFFQDWTAIDRPPLQAAVTVALRPFFSDFSQDYHLLGIALQMLFIPMAYCFLRSCALSRNQSSLYALTLGFTGTTLLNGFYVWPKLFAAGILFALISQIQSATSKSRGAVAWIIGALVSLSMLIHGSSLFALVPIGVAYFWVFRKASIRFHGQCLLSIGLVYLPWVLFQNVQDYPSTRLANWHLAGHPAITDQAFLPLLADRYSTLSFGTWLSYKLSNIKQIWGDWGMAFSFLYPHQMLFDYKLLRQAVFLNYCIALVPFIAALPLLVMHKSNPRTNAQFNLPWIWLGTTLSGLVFWVLAIFLPGHTILHQGTYILLFLPMLYLLHAAYRTHRFLGISLVILNALMVLLAWVFPPLIRHYKTEFIVNTEPINLVSLGLIILIVAAYLWQVFKNPKPTN